MSKQGRLLMLVAIALLCSHVARAQEVIYEHVASFARPQVEGTSPVGVVQATDGTLYGLTNAGGASGVGTIFKIDPSGTLTTLHSFYKSQGQFPGLYGNQGGHPVGNMVQARDGDFYGATSDHGGFFKIDAGGTFTVLDDDVNSRLSLMSSGVTSLLEGSDGRFYGTVSASPSAPAGAVFRIAPGNVVEVLHSFSGAQLEFGHTPGALVEGADGSFYGMTSGGGTAVYPGDGTIFKIDAAGTLTTLYRFEGGSAGSQPSAGLVRGSDGLLYGTTCAPNRFTSTIFSADEFGHVVTLYDLKGLCTSALIAGNDGSLYGATTNGGANGIGTIFSFKNGILATLHQFSVSEGAFPYSLVQGADGSVYGTAASNGTSGGTVFKIDNGGFAIIHRFPAPGTTVISQTGGAFPRGALAEGPDGSVYGTTSDGGANGFGTIYKIDSAGTLTTEYSFKGTDGAHPYAGLTPATGGRFYGTTVLGGDTASGVVFSFDTAGTFTSLSTSTSYPYAPALKAIDGSLHVVGASAAYGGSTRLQIDTSGAVITNGSLAGVDVFGARAGLIQDASGTLYGTAAYDRTNGAGRVFKLVWGFPFLVGYNLSTLHTFDGADGANPYAKLVRTADGSFYGVTSEGGANRYGTIFKIAADGTFSTIHSFNGADGAHPQGAVVELGDGSFLGTTQRGGDYGYGTIFRIDEHGILSTVRSFAGIDGAYPATDLVNVNGAIYGTTVQGGPDGGGVVFRLRTRATSTTLESDLNPTAFGLLIKLTARVRSSYRSPSGADVSPGVGPVDFFDDSTNSYIGQGALSPGTFISEGYVLTSALTPGTHLLRAVYPGNTVLYPSTSALLAQVVVRRNFGTTSLTASSSTSKAGDVVRLVATVTEVVGGGLVDFFDASDGDRLLGSVTLPVGSGQASLLVSTLSPGPHSLRAAYRGDVYSTASGSVLLSHEVTTAVTGAVAAWGDNADGQLGDGTTSSRATPAPVRLHSGAPFDGVVAIAAGQYHTIAVTSDGAVSSWGLNESGQLGDGTTTSNAIPVAVLRANGSALTNVVSVAAGADHSIALAADGTVWTWGNNDFGQLGDGSTVSGSYARQVRLSGGGVLANIVAIAAGGYHSVALDATGSVWAWGSNWAGELADGTHLNRALAGPVRHANGALLTNITNVSAGSNYTVALCSDGTLWTWGDNVYGQLGDGTIVERDAPVRVEIASGVPLSSIVAVSASRAPHTLALDSGGAVWAWGVNWDGQLGDGSTINQSRPVQVQVSPGQALSSIVDVTAGSNHSMALDTNGTVWTWGYNGDGEIGDGTTTSRVNPIAIALRGNAPASAVRIAAGGHHSIALISAGTEPSLQSTSLSVTASQPVFGGATTLTATLAAGGFPVVQQAIDFSINGVVVGGATTNATGVATLTTSVATLDAATYPGAVTAAFSGTADLSANTASTDLVVTKAPTSISLTATPNPAAPGQPVTLTTVVSRADGGSGVPGGSVTFTDGAVAIGTAPLDPAGAAALVTAALTVGPHSLSTTYSGDFNFQPSSVLAGVSVSARSTGPTNVSGIIASDTRWTLSGSPYIVTDNVLVSPGVTLTIEPGVEVQVVQGAFIRVDGQLAAIGTAAQPIHFTSTLATPNPGSWGGIFFTAGSVDAVVDANDLYVSGSTLQYVTVEWAGVYVEDSFPYIGHATFRHGTTQANFPYGCCITPGALTAAYPNNPDATKRLVVRDSLFEQNGGWAIGAGGFAGAGVVLIKDNMLTGNGGGVSFGDSSALDFRAIGNTVDNNAGAAFRTQNIGTNARFANNRVTRNRGGGWAIYSGSATVIGNYVADNVGGSAFGSGFGAPTLTFNTFERNQGGPGTLSFATGGAVLHHNNIFNNPNAYDIYLNPTGTAAGVDATDNYWAETDPRAIDLKVYDFLDTFGATHGRVTTTTFLSAIDPIAPGATSTPPAPTVVPPAATGSLEGILTQDLTLHAADTPHTLTGKLLVSAGVTLTIEPGVELRAVPDAFIRVDGQLVAIGTAAQPIHFTSTLATPNPGSWGGIFFTAGSVDAVVDANDLYVSGSTLQYVTVEWAGVYVEDSFPYVGHATFRHGTTQANFPYGCCITPGTLTAAYPNNSDATKRLVVRDSVFDGNSGWAVGAGGFSGGGIILVQDNVVTANGAGIAFGDSSSLDFRAIGNTVDNNAGAAFRTQNIGTNARFANNRVTRNRGGGWAIYSGSATLTGNYVADNVGGSAFGSGFGAPTLTFNTFERNQGGPGTLSFATGGAVLHHNNIFNNANTYDIYLNPTGTAAGVDGRDNYWGLTSAGDIGLRVFDENDTFAVTHGVVSYQPFLATADAGAPTSAPPVDMTPPAISLLTPVSGATYAIDQVVVAEYTCSDASGVAACAGPVPNGEPIDTATPGLHSFVVTARDAFGNVSTAAVSYTVIDLPTITIVSPTDGLYDRGSVVIAQYSCQNAATCVGDVPSGSALDTSAPGLKIFSVSATDALGNVTTAFAIYNVSLGACVAPMAGLTAWLPGDGSAADLVSGASATWTGSEAYVPAEAANGFSFASGSHASLPFDQVGPFTLQAWVRTPQRLDPEFTGVISTGGPGQNDTSLQLELDGAGNYRLNVGDVDVALIGPALDTFQHIAVTFDGVTVSVYVNGQLAQSNLWTGSPALGLHVLNLGIDRDGAHPFTGTIDEVQVFNRVLSDAELAQTFLAGAFGFCKNHPPVAAIGASPRSVEATGPLGATVTLDGSASTDPDGDVLSYEWTENGATLGGSSALSATFAIGAHTVTLTASDGKASSSAAVTFTVADTTPPVITVPADITVEATSPAGAVVIFAAPTAVDALDGVTPVSCSSASDSTFALGTTTVACSSSDSRGNGPAQASFHVTVQDTTAPSLTAPATVFVEATSAAGAIVTFAADASDSVDGVVPVICSQASGTMFTLGTTSVTCAATDARGNSTGTLITVTVQDTRPPTLTVPPADITVEATGLAAAGTIVTFAASAIDIVDGATAVNCSRPSGSLFPLGTTTVSCSSMDAHGNLGTAPPFAVNVVDTTGPVLTPPGDIVAEAVSPLGAVVTYTVSATDAVSGSATIGCAPASGSGFAIGTTTVSCTATDAALNQSAGSFHVVVRDSTPPAATVTSPATDAALSAATVDVVVQASDSVGVAGVSVNGVAATMIGGTAQSGTWRATVPVTLPVAPGGALRFDVVASDAAGNNGPATLLVDNDGTPKALDRGRTSGVDQSNVNSNDFNNDVTAGTIARNGWTAKLSSVAPTGTVQATISGSGTGPAVISACLGVAKEVRLDVAGETANISCNPTTGTITVKAVSAVTRIELREQLAAGTWQQFSLPTGQMMSVGSPAIGDSANTEPIDAQIIQIDAAGTETVVGAYQLTPGASVDVSATTDAAGTVDIQFDVISGTITTTVGGDTRTVAQGETVTLPVTGPLKTAPVITWAAPAGIVYGTALGATQLNATANVPGTFAYQPAAGTVLSAGASQPLSVTFTPTDSAHYLSATAAVSIAVAPATPTVSWNAPAAIAMGTALSGAQLNATANVPGTFVYTPALGTVLPAGAAQTLSVEFTPTDGANYAKATKSVTITVFASAVAATDVSITEGNSTGATRQVLIPVKLAAKSSEWIAVSYTTADGTAQRDVDYFAISDTVWFAPGVVSQSVAIPIVQDTVGEATESFFVDFTAVINGAPSQARATVTIVNDDSSAQVFTSTADFAAGTLGGAYIAETDDGELTLAPRGSEFSGTLLPDGWTSAPLAPNSSIVVANGKLTVNGAAVTLAADSAAGPTLEFAAVFTGSPEQRIGFAAGGISSSLAMFVVKSDGELYARSVNGARVVESLMAGIDWLAKSHRYKIVWTSGGAQYFIDGTLMITHGSMAWGSATMQPAAVDPIAGDGALTVDWLRATPYAAAGTYTSAVFDAGAAVLWQKLTATSSVPSGAAATFTYRTGNTPVPDASWTSFTAPVAGGTLTGSSRYMQFAIQLGSTVVTKTPVVQEVTVQFKR